MPAVELGVPVYESQVMACHKEPILCCCYSRDGKMVVAAWWVLPHQFLVPEFCCAAATTTRCQCGRSSSRVRAEQVPTCFKSWRVAIVRRSTGQCHAQSRTITLLHCCYTHQYSSPGKLSHLETARFTFSLQQSVIHRVMMPLCCCTSLGRLCLWP